MLEKLRSEKTAIVKPLPEVRKLSLSDYLQNKRRAISAFDSIEKTSLILANEVSSTLVEYVEDLPTYKADFRASLKRAFMRVLTASFQNSEEVVVFAEAIPGFTLMLFKRDRCLFSDDQGKAYAPHFQHNQENLVLDEQEVKNPEMVACSLLAQQYFRRTGFKVLSVETEDVVFAFFRVQDLKGNLKEMGYLLLGNDED